MSYDKKMRKEALKYRATHTQSETSEVFGVSVSAIKAWQKLQKEQGNVEKAKLKRTGRKIKTEE